MNKHILVPYSGCDCSGNTWNHSILATSKSFLYPWDLDKFPSNTHFCDLEEVLHFLVTSHFQSFHSMASFLLPHPLSPQRQTDSVRNPVTHPRKESAYFKLAYWGKFPTSSRYFYEDFIYLLLKEKIFHLIIQLKDSISDWTIWDYQYLTISGL